jgi:YD repeat-containing protein
MGLLLLSIITCTKENPANYYDLLSPYRIDTFRYATDYGYDTIKFTYEPWGDPLTLTRTNPMPGSPNFSFRYDRNHHLTDFIGTWGPKHIGSEFWHKYFYDAQGRITLDSEYLYITTTNDRITSYLSRYGYQFQYDEYGRITRQYDPAQPAADSNYTYDNRGNLIDPQNIFLGSPYDNKVSFQRTNWIWMFIDRDFSVNNSFIADTYNVGSLPLHWRAFPNGTAYKKFLEINYYREAWVTYKR